MYYCTQFFELLLLRHKIYLLYCTQYPNFLKRGVGVVKVKCYGYRTFRMIK